MESEVFSEDYLIAKTVENKKEFLKGNILNAKNFDFNDFSQAFHDMNELLTNTNLLVVCLPIFKYNGDTHFVNTSLDLDEIKKQLAGSVVIVYAPTKENNKLEWKCKIIN